MSILDIVKWPDKRLQQKSQKVIKIDKKLQNFMDDMLETMYNAQGIGLAAVQVGVLSRIIVIDIGYGSNRYPDNEDYPTKPLFIINPEIISTSNNTSIFKEGCLSFPQQFANVKRPAEIKISYLDYFGKTQSLDAQGLLATCIQHEIDHLNGTVFIDHISSLKRNIINKKIAKQNK